MIYQLEERDVATVLDACHLIAELLEGGAIDPNEWGDDITHLSMTIAAQAQLACGNVSRH